MDVTLQHDESIESKTKCLESLDIGPGNCRQHLFRLIRNRLLDERPCKSKRMDVQVSFFPDNRDSGESERSL
jgi:hypothetical protein